PSFTPGANASSNWSTASTTRSPGRRRSSAADKSPSTARESSVAGRIPGLTTTRRPSRDGSRPARSNDDLPLPDGPVSSNNDDPSRRASSSSTRRSRPKKSSASSGSNGARPLNGQPRPSRGGGPCSISSSAGGSSAGSCSRIARSSSFSSTPGTRPSSSSKS